MSARYYIQGFKLHEGEWVSCSPSGETTGYGEPMSPGAVGGEIFGAVVEDSPFRYSLGSGLDSTSCGSLSLQIPNHDGYYGGMGGDLPFSLFVERQDEYLLLLSVFVPTNEFAHYGDAYEGTGAARCVWRGFLSNSRFINGGDYVVLDFNDLTYYAGRFRCGEDYSLIGRKGLFDRLADMLPFVVGDDADPDDHGVDDHIEDLPPVWDMRMKTLCQSLTAGFVPIEIVRKDENTVWYREGAYISELDLATGNSYPVSPYMPAYEPPPEYEGSRWLHDPAIIGIDGLVSLPVPHFVDTDDDLGVVRQAAFGYNVYWVRAYDSDLWLRIRVFSPTTGAFSVLPDILIGDPEKNKNWDVVVGRAVGGNFIAVISPVDIMETASYTWNSGVGVHSVPASKTGWVKHYVRGHTIGGVEYPFLGYREDRNLWIWSRVLTGGTMEHARAQIVGEASERAKKVSKGDLYPFSNSRYPNAMCYTERYENSNILVIVNDRFEVLDKLYPGESNVKPPPTASIAVDIPSLTITGSPPVPTMLAYCPQGHPESILTDPLHVATLQHDVPDIVPRLFVADESVGKAISKAAKAFGAWVWIKPNMRMEIRTPGSPIATGVDLFPHTTLEDGNEDEICYWEKHYESIKVEYGADRELTIGINRWETKQGNVDLKGVVFAEDFAEKIGMQDYIVYNPRRLHLQTPLMRALLFDLWSEFEMHGRKWAVLETEMEPLGLSGFVSGINAPVSLARVWGETAYWFEFVIYDKQWGWYYNGMIPVVPDCPWGGTDFIGDLLGYPPAVNELLRALLDRIVAELNDEGYIGDFDSWWERNNMRFWDSIYEIVMLLVESGYYE